MLERSRATGAPAITRLALLAVPIAFAGCTGSGATDPGSSISFSKQISLSDAQGIFTSGVARVKIELIPGSLTARKVVIEQGTQLMKAERIQSHVTSVAVASTGDADTLVLALGAMRVVFNSSTTFRGEHEFEDGEAHESAAPLVSQAGFVARLQALLTAGRHPSVEVDRQPPTMPQGSTDSTFFAAVVRLDEEADRPGIAMNVSAANFLANATPPPDAWLQVLNRKIELRVSDGTTRIEQRGPRTTGELHFEGMVSSVDATAGTATLADGTILRIVAGTEIEGAETDPDDGSLTSLAAVKAALTAGSSVIAKGEAVLETASPRTLDVIEVRFRLMDDIDFATPD